MIANRAARAAGCLFAVLGLLALTSCESVSVSEDEKTTADAPDAAKPAAPQAEAAPAEPESAHPEPGADETPAPLPLAAAPQFEQPGGPERSSELQTESGTPQSEQPNAPDKAEGKAGEPGAGGPGEASGAETRPGVAALPPEPPPAPEPAVDANPERLMGLDQVALTELLGTPAFVRQDPPAQLWRYRGEGCRIDLFLYRESEQDLSRYIVRHYDVRAGGKPVEAPEACLKALLLARMAKQTG